MASTFNVGRIVEFGGEHYVISGSREEIDKGFAEAQEALLAYLETLAASPQKSDRSIERSDPALSTAREKLVTVLALTNLSYKLIRFSC